MLKPMQTKLLPSLSSATVMLCVMLEEMLLRQQRLQQRQSRLERKLLWQQLQL
jgi:hypothetical protein